MCILEKLNFKISQGSMPLDPLVYSCLPRSNLQYRSEISVPKYTQNTRMRTYAYAYIRVCVCVYTRMRMCICAYTLCARMLISMYKLAGLFFLLLIVDCSFNDPTLRHLKVHGRMNKSCRAKESLHVYFYRKY